MSGGVGFPARRESKVQPAPAVPTPGAPEDKALVKQRYGFLDEAKTEFVWTGFDDSAVALVAKGPVAMPTRVG